MQYHIEVLGSKVMFDTICVLIFSPRRIFEDALLVVIMTSFFAKSDDAEIIFFLSPTTHERRRSKDEDRRSQVNQPNDTSIC